MILWVLSLTIASGWAATDPDASGPETCSRLLLVQDVRVQLKRTPELIPVYRDWAEEHLGLTHSPQVPGMSSEIALASFQDDRLWSGVLAANGFLKLSPGAKAQIVARQVVFKNHVADYDAKIRHWLSYLPQNERAEIERLTRERLPRAAAYAQAAQKVELRHLEESPTVILEPATHWVGRSAERKVNFSHRIAVDRYLTTQGDWWLYTGGTPSAIDAEDQADGDFLDFGSHSLLALHPVECVTWWAAAAYANLKSRAAGLVPFYNFEGIEWEGRFEERLAQGTLRPRNPELAATLIRESDPASAEGYRLPTGDETEAFIRAGTKTVHFFGQGRMERYGWLRDNSDGRTHAVGLKESNPLGVRDTFGNVAIWTSAVDNSGREIRSGGWEFYSDGASSYRRIPMHSEFRMSSLGLRLVRTVE